MTHSLHRQGSIDSLREDYVVLSFGDTYFLATLRARFRRKFPRGYAMLERVLLQLGIRKILRAIRTFRPKEEPKSAVVLNSKEELHSYLKRVKEANTGKSIIVSGVFDEVNSCLKELGLCPHTVQFSLGHFGRTELLPRPEVLEVTTMCGHHMVSPRLVETLVSDVATGKATPEGTVQVMARLCSCGIFNQSRAAKIIEDLVK